MHRLTGLALTVVALCMLASVPSRVAARDDAGAEAVVEHEASVLETILKMKIGGDGRKLVRDS